MSDAIHDVPAPRALFRNSHRNTPKSTRRIAAAVVELIRSEDFDTVWTVPEIDEWIAEWGVRADVDLACVSFATVRAEMKRQSHVRCELRRLLHDPAYEFLRRRNKARRRAVPDRAWIFFVDPVPESIAPDAQLEGRLAA